ncbi:Thiol-disulfide oxidoreductase ResA [Anatilimnocola aggregata]|uniref:Thiol-disulfide oxidoreductase ResA n=1 Tax=Anatilimnocola aggregata TaxID=2528021 RepID=A0A517YIY0_9BACT|nr:thioredoxin-like domain-containing protein [Anatilimnocola aggregata]QDU30176.1 Thiol-disulfide oxidoreductase ResA [Anatilimnocola aggregata]
MMAVKLTVSTFGWEGIDMIWMATRGTVLMQAFLVLAAISASGCVQEAASQPKYKPAAETAATTVAEATSPPVTESANAPPGLDPKKEVPEVPPADKPVEQPAAGPEAATEAPPDKETLIAMQAPGKAVNPFRRRLEAPDFPKGMEWINTKPLSKKDLKGKFVLLDFWTYCCINCMHILPELKKLEKQYPNELVVIGVHSAKFDTEKDRENILAAVLRYEIEHPVVNDADHKIWDTFGINSWPTALLIDPEGQAVWGRSGEFKADEVAEVLNSAIPFYKENKLLDDSKPFPLDLEAGKQLATPLRFPGKILADEPSGRLFISDSNHNRIVITDLDGKLLDIIGSGAIGKDDGAFQTASFDHPQGCVLHGDTLYVADTENHLLRKVDLKAKTVKTIAGVGSQAKHPWPGLEEARLSGAIPERWAGKPLVTGLNSPWDLWIHGKNMYIAMAGPHQIWMMPLDESEIGPYAGNGREDIVDGPLMPPTPYEAGFSSFAQPSGLSSDGEWLFVADSEGSSIRAVPFDRKQEVRTVVGSNLLPGGRLFAFGDSDGPKEKAKLQHALGVTYLNGQLYITDTYNDKIKVVDAKTGETTTLAGTGEPGKTDEPATFDEPAGISHAKGKLYIADTNNHLIRTLDLATKKVNTLAISGLTSPAASKAPDKKPTFKGALQEAVPLASLKPTDGSVKVNVQIKIPTGWKVNPLAPMSYWVDSAKAEGPVSRTSFGRKKLGEPTANFEVVLPVTGTGEDEINISLNYYYCQDADEGVCKIGSVVFTVPLKIADDAKESSVVISHVIPE